jgi:cytochrome c-type biogenesis protein CcmH/NrfG
VAAAIFVVSFAAFAPSLQNNFTEWDDPGYVTESTLIRDLSGPGIRAMFTRYVQGNYHPLTLLSLAIDYRMGGLSPRTYHLTNVALNAVNSALVFWFALLLTGSLPVATVAGVFFGIHPLHVESVAWVSARKDLLYALFFLGSCIAYMFAVRGEHIRWGRYLLALFLFLLALLCKGMAVPLPLVFLLIDWYRRKPLTIRSLVEKSPFFLLALVLGFVAIVAQRQQGAIQKLTLYPLGERLLFAAYGLMAYLWKAFVPVGLSALYPYPRGSPWSLPAAYYVSPVVISILAVLCWRARRRVPLLTFGAAFFLLTVVLVLQLLPVGRAVIADRYTYVPYIGLGLALGASVPLLGSRSPVLVRLVVALLVAFGAMLFATTGARCRVWRENITLWTDVIRKDPNVGVAYNNLALTFKDRGEYSVAMAYLDRALAVDSTDLEAWANRGNILFLTGRNDSAIASFNRALAMNPNYPVALTSRGAVHFKRGEFEEARADFDRALSVQPDSPQVLLNRASVLRVLRRWPEALADYDAYLRFDPKNARVRAWREQARDSLRTQSASR